MAFLPIMSNGTRVYAGFWKRFCAVLLDFCIIALFGLLFIWLEGFGRTLAIIIAIPSSLLFQVYSIFFNARFGGTPGKLLVGIRITKPDGSQIGWPEAWKRSAVDIAFNLIILLVTILALIRVDPIQYVALPFMKRMFLLQTLWPSWYGLVIPFQQVWFWSNIAFLLIDKRKRALHDLIAGTIVVEKAFAEYPSTGQFPAMTPDE